MALTADQTAAYITQRLLLAGTSEQLFTPEAVIAIQNASRGIPRVINLICEHALIFGYVEQLRLIPVSVIESVSQDLDLDTQPFLVPQTQLGFPTSR